MFINILFALVLHYFIGLYLISTMQSDVTAAVLNSGLIIVTFQCVAVSISDFLCQIEKEICGICTYCTFLDTLFLFLNAF